MFSVELSDPAFLPVPDPVTSSGIGLQLSPLLVNMDSLPAYSSIEVAKHASREDAWLIIGGKVLNISSWLDEHPGGDDVLLEHVGRDATRDFEYVGHSGEARAQLDGLVIGTVRPATDEELRISSGADQNNPKLAVAAFLAPQFFQTWIQDNVAAMKRAGFVGIASATIVGLALLVRKYTSTTFTRVRR